MRFFAGMHVPRCDVNTLLSNTIFSREYQLFACWLKMFFWILVEKFMLSVRFVLEICGLKVVVSFNFALSAPHVKRRVKSCEPSAAAATSGSRLLFSGDEDKYELWEVKFIGYMQLKKLHTTILPATEGGFASVDGAKNADAFAELVQCLDDRSLSLVIRDAKDDGRKALQILQEHYLSAGKPRIIALYTELTSLKKDPSESVTDYMIQAETAANMLKTAKEQISDSLLVAMVLKGLPSEFKPFATVITQKDKPVSFSDFKTALRSYEETERCCDDAASDVRWLVSQSYVTVVVFRATSQTNAGRGRTVRTGVQALARAAGNGAAPVRAVHTTARNAGATKRRLWRRSLTPATQMMKITHFNFMLGFT